MKILIYLVKILFKNHFIEMVILVAFLVYGIIRIFNKKASNAFARQHIYPMYKLNEKTQTLKRSSKNISQDNIYEDTSYKSHRQVKPMRLSKPDRKKNKSRKNRSSKGERECKRVLERIFKVRFKKYRPDFLRNPVTGGAFNLELDCYNKGLKLAVEYHGKQHYKFTPFFHKSVEAFRNQQYRDYLKKLLCKKRCVRLIEVPYTVKVEDIERYLRRKLR